MLTLPTAAKMERSVPVQQHSNCNEQFLSRTMQSRQTADQFAFGSTKSIIMSGNII
jgi:hypothetical protein